MKPSSLGAILGLFLTGTATYGSASALSQGLNSATIVHIKMVYLYTVIE